MSQCPVLISTVSAKSFGQQCPNKCEETVNEHGLYLCKKHQAYNQEQLDTNIRTVTATKLNKDIRTSNDEKNITILAQHPNELPLFNKMHEIVAFCQIPIDKLEEARKHTWYINKGNAYNEKKETIQKCIDDVNVTIIKMQEIAQPLNTMQGQEQEQGQAYITLKNNKRVIVDADKLSELNQFTWHENNNTKITYIETDIKRKKIRMSRYLMNPEPNEDVIYLNNDTFDNRIQNLKICAKGRRNEIDINNNYIGVRKTPSGKYQARLVYDGKHHVLGTFNTAEEAHQARHDKLATL